MNAARQVPAVVLCVDDEIIALSLRKRVLEKFGFSVLTATSSDEALETFRHNHVDLVLTDHLLLCSTGTALAAAMKKLKPNVPVAILSGVLQVPEDLHHADLFIPKAAEISELVSSLETLLAARK